jgi:hypothetical protein
MTNKPDAEVEAIVEEFKTKFCAEDMDYEVIDRLTAGEPQRIIDWFKHTFTQAHTAGYQAGIEAGKAKRTDLINAAIDSFTH